MKKFSGYFAIIIFLFFLSLIFYSIDEIFIFRTLTEAKRFEIEKGEGADSVIARLKDDGLIRNKLVVRFFLISTGIHKDIKGGIYTIGPTYSVKQIFDQFVMGGGPEVRIFEGWTIKEIAAALKGAGLIVSEAEFQKAAFNFDNSESGYAFLPRESKVNLEGYLFPDTYRLEKSPVAELIKMMLDNFDRKVYSKYKNKSAGDLREILIMASMLEREVRTEADMKLVSGILWKRLESELPLQVDATLVYIKCNLLNVSNCRALAENDKKIKSPYNTYLNQSLPPAPISNPGLLAVFAAAGPEGSDFWYYLSARDDGRTIFSRTLNEHNLNRSVYR